MEWNKFLLRQLKKLKLTHETVPGDVRLWQLFVESINTTYNDADYERYLSDRIMNISSQEMLELNQKLIKAQRTALMCYWSYHCKSDIFTWSKEAYSLLKITPTVKIKYLDDLLNLIHKDYREVIDVDRFKLINDSLGHAAGDLLLTQIAQRFQMLIGDGLMLGRLSGDEFVAILDDVVDRQAVYGVAQALIKSLDIPFDIYHHSIVVNVSIGISVYPENGLSSDDLFKAADAAMYSAKLDGSSHYQLYTDHLKKDNLARLDQETELRRAIKAQEFFVCYQPQFDTSVNELISTEALVRWRHPTKGIVLPFEFIPLAEETGLIVELGEWVMHTACAQNKQWQDQGYEPIRVAVNVSTKQFLFPGFAQIVNTILQETQLDPQYLEIEVTENVIINNKTITSTLNELKELGVCIVLDDFGTGSSSINYLKQIPIDTIKIDQSFIKSIGINTSDEIIIQSIISMAKGFNIKVIAEGVENQSQLTFLENEKCKHIQGFMFSKAVESAEIIPFLKQTPAASPKK